MLKEWREDMVDRKRFLGGTDIAAILGLSKYKTALYVWAIKTGQIEPVDDDALHKKLGKRLEEVVAELFTEKTGKRVIRANAYRIHRKHDFLCAQIDRLVVGEDALLECKTTSSFGVKEWDGDEIPADYIAQVMFQLAITGRAVGYIACLIGNHKFVWKEIKRDPVMIAEMVKRAVDFWENYVIPKIPPAGLTAKDKETLALLYPTAEIGSEITLEDDIVKLIESRNALRQDSIQIGKEIDRVENEIKMAMKSHEIGITGPWRVLWRNQKRKEFMVPATEFRKFEIKPNKEA